MGEASRSMKARTRRQELAAGVRETIPLLLSAAPFGVVFGALGVSSGLSGPAVVGLSLFVFAGSAQFVAAGLVAQGMSVPLIVLATFVVNLRHALYATSLGVYLKRLPQRWLAPLAFWLTDETFAVTVRRYREEPEAVNRHWYQLGSSVAMYLNWQAWTAVGLLAGTGLSNVADWGLDFAMAVTFIGIVVPLVTTRPMLLCALVSGAVAMLAAGLPHNLGLIVAALAGMSAGVILESLARPAKGPSPQPPAQEPPAGGRVPD